MARLFSNWRPAVLAAALLLAGMGWGTAKAQYPPPTGNVTLTSSITAPQVGGTTIITAYVRDIAGTAVAGLACTFNIASQPGLDAAVYPGPVLTDPTGAAPTSLQVGSTPGPIVVDANCGDLTAQASVVAGAAAAVQLPATGLGPGSDHTSRFAALWLLLGVSLAAMGLVVARDLARRARR